MGPQDATAFRSVTTSSAPIAFCLVGSASVPAAHGASPGSEVRGGGWRSETSRRGAGGRACFAHGSAVGLRPSPSPTALRCSAPRASSRGRRRRRPVLTPSRTAPTRSPRPGCAGQPWAPALLAASEIAKQERPPAPLCNAPRLAVQRSLKCAREGERDRRSRGADGSRCDGSCGHRFRARARAQATREGKGLPFMACARAPCGRRRRAQVSGASSRQACTRQTSAKLNAAAAKEFERELGQWPHVPDVHARLHEGTSMYFLQSEEASSSGEAGVAVWRLRKRRRAPQRGRRRPQPTADA
jgi:hypothetical protein